MRSSLPRVLVILLTAAVLAAGALLLGFAGALQYLAPEIPAAAQLREIRVQLPLSVRSRDDKLIAQFGEQRRIPLSADEIPQIVVDAFLAAEDARFYSHPGVDWQGLLRALLSNVAAGGVREGGGTITMQLARNTVLSSERTLRRKLKEVFLALRLEREFSKQEILTLYLNRIFLGQRAYGVGAAAEVYFAKPAAELGLAEAALIAGLPRSPSRDNPVASVERARDRRAYVLRRMLETGHIDPAARDAALAVPIDGRLHGPDLELDAPWIAEMARAEMVARYGPAALVDGYTVRTTVDSRLQALADGAARQAILEYERRHGYRGPLTQIDSDDLTDAALVADVFRTHHDLGNLAVAVVESVAEKGAVARLRDDRRVALRWEDLSWARRALPRDRLGPAPATAAEVLAPGQFVYLEPLADGHFRLAQQPAVAGALVALDPHDGAIVAVTGGFAFFDSRYNRALQARRQPGSAFKPFLYSAALESGFTPATLINDAPVVIEGGTPEEEWRPQNITKRFYGPTPLREGLVRSRNLVSIRLLRGIGLGPAVKHIGQFGFGAAALPANLTLALGTGQVTPLEMARGFAVFANGGYLVTPYAVERVTDNEGRIVYEAAPKLACAGCVQSAALGPNATGPVPPDRLAPAVITPANAFVMTDMMVDVIQRGTAQLARSLGRLDLAGKTGTTNDRRDAWFVGFNADLTAATWIGFDQERSLGEQEEGARTALPMWVHFMGEALRDRPEHRQPEPPGVVRMWVSRATGAPAAAGEFGAVFETFLAGHSPQSGGALDAGFSGTVDAESVEPASNEESIF
ncbi:MAG TPA: PBP1A family penicillin-binding protein [Burkholderiales bacterium]|nr:PBP1A family penicillin-binding protein [Burkholderiales bacterium]